ncbi:MAG TPA: hypothetical protein PK733_15205 [Clostridiales bacterium]|nr:hypothetical protein [Clostridiales bacterium]
MDRKYLMYDRKWIANYHGKLLAKGSCSFNVCIPKKGTPFIKADKPWESMSTGWGTMLYEDGLYRMWYEAWDSKYKNDHDGFLCYAESKDGENWIKPELGIYEYEGSTKNNIVYNSKLAGNVGFHGHTIFIDPTSPENARYRMVHQLATKTWHEPYSRAFYLMGLAYSADGINWKQGVPEYKCFIRRPCAPFGSDTQSVVYYDRKLRKYVGYFRNWEYDYKRSIARSETTDLTDWPVPKTIIEIDELDKYGVDFYNTAASKYESGSDEAHFMFISMYDHVDDTLNVEMAFSRDGIRFKRDDRTIIAGNDTPYDMGGIYVCPGIFNVGDKCLVAYHGVDYKHEEALPNLISYAGNFNFLTYEKDRLRYMNIKDYFEFNLDDFICERQKIDILINADTGTDGSIYAAIYNINPTEVIEGFSLEDCIPVVGNGLNMKLDFKNGNIINNKYLGKKIGIRFYAKKCKIYSIEIKQ